jgi:hypothetical protein
MPSAVRLRQLLALALLATAVVATVMLILVVRTNHGVPGLLSAGRAGAGSDVVARDFPNYHLPAPLPGPAQWTYLIAREPTHLADAAHHLDRPRYRLQAIGFPLLAWAAHPTGGGRGLVITMWGIAAAGVVLCAFAAAALASALGASARASRTLALVIPLLPMSVGAVALTTADALGLGLALSALSCDTRHRRTLASVLAVLAVFVQPASGVVLLGWAIWRGRASVLRIVAIPALCAAAWAVTLWARFSSTNDTLQEFSPLHGLASSLRAWALGDDRIAALAFTIAVVIALAVLARDGVRSPLGPILALQFLLIATLAATSLAGDWNAIRMTGPLLTIGVTALTVPRRLTRNLSVQ